MGPDDIRFRIAAARRMLHRNGCDSGVAGHVSVRAAEGESCWITPFEYFDETTPDRVVRVSFDGVVQEGAWQTSPAISFHADVYRARRDVDAIVHTHSHWASVVGTTGRPVGMYNEVSTLFHGNQAFHVDDGSQPPGGPDGEKMATSLGVARVLHMRNHGVLLVAESLEAATIDAIALEKAARIHHDAVRIGGTEMPQEQVRWARREYDLYYRPAMWEANLRRLRRSDPDLFEALDDDAGASATRGAA